MKRILLSAVAALLTVVCLNAQTVYYSEDFEGGVPDGWTLEDEWKYGAASDLASQYFPFTGNDTKFVAFNDDAAGASHKSGGRVISAEIDLTEVTGPLVLEFRQYFVNGDYDGADETAKVFYSEDAGENWVEISDLSAGAWGYAIVQAEMLAGKTVMLAFEYKDGDGWNYGFAIDDVTFVSEPVNVERKNYAITADGGSQFSNCAKNVDYKVGGVFINYGYEPVTSFDISVERNEEVVTETFSGLNVERGGAYRYSVAQTFNTGETPSGMTVSVTNVNGETEADNNNADNMQSIAFNPVSINGEQAVVVEEATGAWCSWCPRGTVYLDEMSKRFGDQFVGIAVHNNDALVNSEYDSLIRGFDGFQGFPSVIFNRTNIIDPSEIVDPSITKMQTAPTLVAELSASEDGNTLNSRVRVTFANAQADANYNVSVVLTEDDIVNDDSQSNSYSGGANGSMGGFEFFGSSVPASIWPFSHVGRGLVGGFAGVNEITGAYTAGQAVTVDLPEFNMDASWVKENMHAIAIVTDASGKVVNALSMKYADALANEFTATKEIEDENLANVYPNPVSSIANVTINTKEVADVTIEIIDMMGKTMTVRNIGNVTGKRVVSMDVSDLSNGVYLVKVNAGQFFTAKKIMVTK